MWRSKFMAISRLDAFEQYKKGVLYDFGGRPEYTEQLFVNQLLKLDPPSAKMMGGIAVHELVEKMGFQCLEQPFLYKDWLILPPEQDLTIEMPQARELKTVLTIDNISIYGRVDAIDCNAIHDLKTTSKIDAERYFNSWQWRAYLLAENKHKFIYDILTVKICDELQQPEVRILDYTKLEMNSYNAMYEDVRNILHEYWDCLESLKELIKETAIKNNILIKGLTDGK